MQVSAKANYLRMSPRKIRLVADLARGLDAEEAIKQLTFNKKWASEPLLKVVKSAIANAEENFKLKRENLFIEKIQVNGGPTLHRSTPRAHGRATPIRKRTAHITLILGERLPTDEAIVKAGKKKTPVDDIVKLEDLDQIKKTKDKTDLNKDINKEIKGAAKKAKGGFSGKMFNRRSGEK